MFAYSKLQNKAPESRIQLYDFYYEVIDPDDNIGRLDILKINLES
jgi:hypothetical protein